MELKNTEILYSSDQCEILLGEGENGRLYTRKNSGINPEAAEKLRSIHSPYIAGLAEYGEDFTILEYAPGVPLSKAKLNKDRLYGISCELCEGLSALHGAGVIHRDIKPSNVILRDDGHITIIDFDAARVKKPTADKDTSFIGTDGFAPPEQYGFMQTDERSDIYALGVTMKLLCDRLGCLSYRGVVEKCMRFNPEQRYSSAKQVKRALFLCRYRVAFAAAAVLVIAAGAAVSGISINQNDPVPAESPVTVTSETGSNEIMSTAEIPQTTPPQTTAPVTPAAFEIPPDSVRELPWEALVLPEGMPRLADKVTEFTKQATFISITWDKMNGAETDHAAAAIRNWLGCEAPDYESSEPDYQAHFSNEKYSVDVTREDSGKTAVSVQISDPEERLYFGETLSDMVKPSESSVRAIPWNSAGLPENIPVLSESLTDFSEDSYRYTLKWDSASAAEAANMVELLCGWLDCDVIVYTNYFGDDYSVQWLLDSPDGNTVATWNGFKDGSGNGELMVTVGKGI